MCSGPQWASMNVGYKGVPFEQPREQVKYALSRPESDFFSMNGA